MFSAVEGSILTRLFSLIVAYRTNSVCVPEERATIYQRSVYALPCLLVLAPARCRHTLGRFPCFRVSGGGTFRGYIAASRLRIQHQRIRRVSFSASPGAAAPAAAEDFQRPVKRCLTIRDAARYPAHRNESKKTKKKE